MMKLRRLALLPLFMLAACNSWMGEPEAPPIAGNRIPVLMFDKQLQADSSLTPFTPPAVIENMNWPNVGGNATHEGGNLAFKADGVKAAWSRDIGHGLSDNAPTLASPVVSSGKIFTLDTEGVLTAFQQETGKPAFTKPLANKRLTDKSAGGGLAAVGDVVYATLGYGEVMALKADDGTVMWRTKMQSPIRSAPAVSYGHVYVVSLDNQLAALDATSGEVLWSHSGMAESTGLLGAPCPAIGHDLVLAAYSSGELYALRPANGGELWSDNLASNSSSQGGIMSIGAIRGMPVLANNGALAIAVSNAGHLVAIDTRSGQRMWEQRVSSTQMPWVAGDTVFVISAQAQLMALNLTDGRLRWVSQLGAWENATDKMGLISWYGPVMAGGNLWLTNNRGHIVAFNPTNGVEGTKIKTGAALNRPPLVANGVLYTLDDEATLTAWH